MSKDKQKQATSVTYVSRIGEMFVHSQSGNTLNGRDIGKMGIYSDKLIMDVANKSAERSGRKPAIDEIAPDIMLSPQLTDLEGKKAHMIYFDPLSNKYTRSKTISEMRKD